MIKRAVIFSIGFGSILFVTSPAQADQLQAFLKCRTIAKDASRLACFDAVAQKSAVAHHVPVDRAAVKAAEVNNFGKGQLRNSPVKQIREARKKAVRKTLNTIRPKVVKYLYTNSGKFVLFMKNGQVWKQQDDGWIHLPKGEFKVKIEKGAFSSYNMIVPGRISIIKVKRLR
ncbi:MAG: hypothetical protein GXP02_07980 [Alphaproteobacteria bacterium]|nr:hypothetical protein [Alphaproteobacteria bacterium]